MRRVSVKESVAGYIFISPWLIGFLIFTLGPILASIYLSFNDYDVLNPAHWVGFANYSKLFREDPLFWKALYNTLYMVVLGVPLQLLMGLGIAMLLNMDVKGMEWYRTVYYLPSIVPVVASAYLWLWILNPQFGILNNLLYLIGIEGPGWLGSEVWSKPSLLLMRTWAAGSNMIIYLAALKGVPVHLYEAASIDGATGWRKFWHITLPQLTPTLFFTSTMGLIQGFQLFTESYVMTNGGPVDSTLFIVYHLFNQAFAYFKMGYASAIAWILFVLILIVTAIQMKLSPRWVHYESS
ncbi:MAG: sugar ABC transporter permease [Firmicutes bacterium]|nr:sugar ABC transporter permease [Bacillota bacterium]